MTEEMKLLQAAKDGNTAAFERIVKQYQSLVCAITFSGTGRVDISEELAQETFLSAWKNLHQLTNPNGFKAWLCTIARNMLSSYYRKKKNIPLAPAHFAELPDPSPTPSEKLINKEESAMLEQTLMQMPVEYREPLVMYYRGEKSTRQIAEDLGLNESTVRTRLHRARQLLREEIAGRLERTLGKTAPNQTFTKAVMVALAATGLGLAAATAEGASTAGTAASETAGTLTAIMSTAAAKIITTAAIAVITIGAVFAYKQLSTSPESSPINPVETTTVSTDQNLVATAETIKTNTPSIRQAAAKSPDSPAISITPTVNDPAGATKPVNIKSAAIVTSEEEPVVETDNTFQCKGSVSGFDRSPIANAKVILYHNVSKSALSNRIMEETTSDASGSFTFKAPLTWDKTTSHAYADEYIILATHPNYAFGWHNIKQDQKLENYVLTLTEPTSRTITVTDHDNNLLANVRIWLYGAGNRNSSNPLFRDYLSLPTDIDILTTITDKNGQALITNLPNTRCSFHATLDGYARGLAFSGGKTIRLSPGANIKGRVLAEKNKPVGGAKIRFHTDWMWASYYAITDPEGNFVFKDLPAQGWDMSPWGKSEHANGLYKVTVRHKLFSIPGEEIQLLPNDDITDFIINAYGDGPLIKCKVVDSDTNTPLAGARVQGSSASGRIDDYTDENGILTVRVEPGRVSFYNTSPPDGVYVLRDSLEENLNFQAEGSEMEVTLKAPPIAGQLVTVCGTARDAEGNVLGNTVIYSEADQGFHTSTAGSYIRSTATDNEGAFIIKEVPAGLNLHVYAEKKDRSLAGTAIFEIPADPNKTPAIEVSLEPTQSCKQTIKDNDGTPVRNTAFEIRAVVGGKALWGGYGRTVKTDDQGVLRANGILPDTEYYLRDTNTDNKNILTNEDVRKQIKRTIMLVPIAENAL